MDNHDFLGIGAQHDDDGGSGTSRGEHGALTSMKADEGNKTVGRRAAPIPDTLLGLASGTVVADGAVSLPKAIDNNLASQSCGPFILHDSKHLPRTDLSHVHVDDPFAACLPQTLSEAFTDEGKLTALTPSENVLGNRRRSEYSGGAEKRDKNGDEDGEAGDEDGEAGDEDGEAGDSHMADSEPDESRDLDETWSTAAVVDSDEERGVEDV